jgi:hypothetical protein
MKKYFSSTIFFLLIFCSACGQTKQRGHSSLDKDYYVDGFRVYKNLSKSDSSKILTDIVSKLNGDWTSTEIIVPTEPAKTYTWTYQLNDTTLKGFVLNPDIIMAGHFVRLQIINGQVKIVYSRAIGEWLIDDNTLNIKISGDTLTIGETIYKRLR